MRLGLISDTHGVLREEAVRALDGSDLILHAGDVGAGGILERLGEIAPVVAIRGNIDRGTLVASLPPTAVAEAGAVKIYLIHDVYDLDVDPVAMGFGMVVSGHSHKPGTVERDGVLYVNPGSAGPRRFRLPVTVARLNLGVRPWRVEFVELG